MSVAEPTPPGGHAGPQAAVGHGVSNSNSAVGQSPTRPLRPFRCLRHRAWMAACTDCRKAHTVLTRKPAEPVAADASR